ncbi:Protein Red [Galemys pyrenaicus]|uniref:Protein Red n=1 Tax=Galemys pyrenaicus TaxID=202257 RepID=A0A8J6DW54_GALPY|nr:Protein Red [Galemys pyrenaicus]
MERTHLVKGLDFALLQKVRAEIASKEKEEEELMEKPQKETKKDEDPENKTEFKTYLGRNVYHMLFKRNELFLLVLVAYVVDLNDEHLETRRGREIGNPSEIEKEIEIMTENQSENKDGIQSGSETEREREREREEEKKRHSYFEKPKLDDEPMDVDKGPASAKELIKSISEKFAGSADCEGTESLKKPENKKQLGNFFGMFNSYAECYPATRDDMAVDSNEEVGYSKMDHGNRKGPLGHWDFDTQEEYSEYMNNKEALLKAAFQYAIKMSEGRKTRRFKETNDKGELDGQWKKISAIIEKWKKMKAEGVEVKRPKY